MPTLKVMTWNVENFFPAGTKYGPETVAIYDQKLEVLRATIQGQDPDVIALQEVGGPGPLDDLRTALGVTSYVGSRLSAFPDSRGIRNAFLTKMPIQSADDIVDFPATAATTIVARDGNGNLQPVTRMGRGGLRVSVQKAGRTFQFFNAHLKSKLLTFPRPGGEGAFSTSDERERAETAGVALFKRAAEAVTLRLAVNARLDDNDQAPLLLLGDLNDVPEAQTTQLLYGPEGSQIGSGAFSAADKGDDNRLFNLAPCIPAERRFSRRTAGVNELIDHILASEELLPRVGGDRVLPVVDSLVDYRDNLPSVGGNPGARKNSPFPDHAPLVATFEI